jgi:hypothetical protein
MAQDDGQEASRRYCPERRTRTCVFNAKATQSVAECDHAKHRWCRILKPHVHQYHRPRRHASVPKSVGVNLFLSICLLQGPHRCRCCPCRLLHSSWPPMLGCMRASPGWQFQQGFRMATNPAGSCPAECQGGGSRQPQRPRVTHWPKSLPWA